MKKLFFKAVFFSLLLFSSCNDNIKTLEPIKLQGFIFGTSFTIIYYDVHENYTKEVNTLFEETSDKWTEPEFDAVFLPKSTIHKINTFNGTKLKNLLKMDYKTI